MSAFSCVSVRPSAGLRISIYQRGSHCSFFRGIWYRGLLQKSIDELQISLKSDENIDHFTRGPKRFVLLAAKYVAQQYRKRMAVFPLQIFQYLLHC